MSVESPQHPWPNSTLALHWVAVTALLFLLVPLIGTGNVWSADVGAQLAQSSRLAEGDGWLFSHPLPAVDPAGEWFTFHLSGRTGDNFVVLAKHPLFTWIVAGLWQLGGLGAVMASSVLSTTVAALGAATVVSRSIHQRGGIATLWTTAALSPLAFDGFLGYAHTLAAATAVWSFVFVTHALQNPRGRRSSLFFASFFIAMGPFLRSEATLVGIALGLGLLATSGQWPTLSSRRTARYASVLLGTATMVGFFVDRAWAIPVRYGEPTAVASSWLQGRFSGFNATWLWTASSGWRQQDLLLMAVPVLWYVGARFIDRSARIARLAIGSGAVFGVLWAASDPGHIVPGLLFAFPVLVLLLGLSHLDMFREPVEALGAVSFVAFSAAVILTQHAQGGTSEWGGRYFAVGIPFALIALGGSTQRLVEPRRDLSRSVIGPVLLASLAILGGGLFGIRHSKQLVGRLHESVEQTRQQAAKSPPTSGADNKVVVVSTVNGASRWAWESARDDAWLLVPPEDIDTAMERLSAAGITRVVVVAETRHETDRSLGPYANVDVVQPWEASPLEVLAYHGS